MLASDCQTLISCSDVSFSYEQDRNVLSQCSVNFTAGCVHYVVGPSGCGKSTFGLLLCGILKPHAGKILFADGVKPTMILQFPENLFLTDSVEEELALLPSVFAEERALGVLSHFNLHYAEISGRSPMRLSFGQRRIFACALQTPLGKGAVVYDEPSLGLDTVNLEVMAHLLRDASDSGVGNIVITHDLELLTCLPGDVHLLAQGKFQWHGPSDEFVRRSDLQQLAAAR